MAAVWCLLGPLCSPVVAQTPAASAASQPTFDRDAFRTELQRLQRICQSLGMVEEASICRNWLPPLLTDRSLLYLPLPPLANAADESHRANWQRSFLEARRRYAQTLFAEAHALAASDNEAAAFGRLWQVLREDPEHADAKRILGTLASAVTVKPRLRKGTTPHATFGWPPGSYSRIETPHFVLTSRSEPRASVELAQLMESYAALWRQVFYPLWAIPGSLSNKFAGRNTPWDRPRELQVVLLKDRQEYLRVLGASEQNAAVSVGYYAPQAKTSYFFVADNYEHTLFHELTHQLFAEATSIDAQSDAGQGGGVWLSEGIALYMESLVNRGSYWTLGGIAGPRLQTARYRAVRDGYWAPWDSFTQGTVEGWKQDPQIALLYTQATGLTHLFMDRLPQPQSRQALLRALVSVYRNQPDFAPLRDQLGEKEEQAQEFYQQQLTLTDTDVATLVEAGAPAESLVLAGSQLSTESWLHLSTLAPGLVWFDASFSNARTEDLTWLQQAQRLERLSVEGTHCDGSLLKLVAELPQINELDLSGCAIDDGGLIPLSRCARLQTLWLTDSQITDAALTTLARIPTLRYCHVGGTRITAAAWQRFQREHPQLKSE